MPKATDKHSNIIIQHDFFHWLLPWIVDRKSIRKRTKNACKRLFFLVQPIWNDAVNADNVADLAGILIPLDLLHVVVYNESNQCGPSSNTFKDASWRSLWYVSSISQHEASLSDELIVNCLKSVKKNCTSLAYQGLFDCIDFTSL